MKSLNFTLSFLLFFTCTLFAQDFEVYISDAADNQILKYDSNGENEVVLVDANLNWPQDILFLEDQEIMLVSSLNSGQITKHNITTGAYLGTFAIGISGPTRMKIGPDNLIYVLQWSGDGKVLRYDFDGNQIDEFTEIGIFQSIGLDWDTESNLYVSSYGSSYINKFDPDGNDLGTYINSDLQGPTNIWFDENGTLYALNWNATTCNSFDTEGVFVETFISGLSQAEGVAFLSNGNILIGNGGTSCIKRYDSGGIFLGDFTCGGDLDMPNAVILRNIPMPDAIIKTEANLNFIQPTIGTAFYLKSNIFDNDYQAIQQIKSVAVYHSSGKLIHKKQNVDILLWNANNSAEGLYYIVLTNHDNSKKIQKVIVKN